MEVVRQETLGLQYCILYEIGYCIIIRNKAKILTLALRHKILVLPWFPINMIITWLIMNNLEKSPILGHDSGSVQMYRKWFVFLQQSKISHFSFCNPTTSVLVIFCKSVSLIQKPLKKSITCDQKAWVGRRYNGIFSRSEWCWYIITLTVNKVWLAPSSRSFWVIPTWK